MKSSFRFKLTLLRLEQLAHLVRWDFTRTLFKSKRLEISSYIHKHGAHEEQAEPDLANEVYALFVTAGWGVSIPGKFEYFLRLQ